jgi:hypothetical protein
MFFAEMAHTDDPEAVTTNGLFGFFDSGEAIEGNGETGGEAGGQAGRGGFFGDLEPGLFGEGADLGLGQAGITEGCGHRELSGSGAAGSDFTGVVKVLPVGENRNVADPGEFLHPLEKLRPAEVTTVGWVGGVGGVVQFQGFQNFDRQSMFPGKGQGGGVFRAGKAGGVAEDAGDLGPKNAVGDPKEEGGVNSA